MRKLSLEKDLAVSGVMLAVIVCVCGFLVKIGVITEHNAFNGIVRVSVLFLILTLLCIVKDKVKKKRN